jgi:hypothetical protein
VDAGKNELNKTTIQWQATRFRDTGNIWGRKHVWCQHWQVRHSATFKTPLKTTRLSSYIDVTKAYYILL